MKEKLEKSFSKRISTMSDLEIVNNYNWETIGKGWANARALWLNILRDEIIKRWGEVDWCNRASITLKTPIALVEGKLVQLK